jgi:transcriptional regulator with XRE-family HTH domain
LLDFVSSEDTLFPVLEIQIGANIRDLRNAGGITVAALASKADLTKGTVSKIETGKISPPISTLIRIASALGVPLARLMIEPHVDPPFVLTRNGHGRQITRDGSAFGYSYAALALPFRQKRIEPFVLTVAPTDPVGRFQHGGQEFIYMLSGTLEITVGEERMQLRPGDSLYFDPTHVHTTRAVGKAAARFLCIFVQEPLLPVAPPRQRARERKK